MTIEYRKFDPPARPEEFVGRMPSEVLQDAAEARVAKRPGKYLVLGEWVRDRKVWLDIGINREWVTWRTHYQLLNGHLRWVCPGCGKLYDAHQKGCEYR